MLNATAKPVSSLVVVVTALLSMTAIAATPGDPQPAGISASSEPEILYAPLDYYTPAMRKAGVRGMVRFKVCIDAAGKIVSTDMIASSGSDSLDQTAAEVVRKYRFKAGTAEGVPTGSCFGIPIRFTPDGRLPDADPAASTRAEVLSSPNMQDYYPQASLQKGEQGIVRVRICFDEKGRTTGATVDQSSGFPQLDAAALRAGKQFRFKPGTRNGVPQADCLVAPMLFHAISMESAPDRQLTPRN